MCHVSIHYACCLKHWVLCTEVDKLKTCLSPLPTCLLFHFYFFFLGRWLCIPEMLLLLLTWVDVQQAERSGERGAGRGNREMAVSWTKIVKTLLSMFGLLPWVYDHQTSCSWVILQDLKKKKKRTCCANLFRISSKSVYRWYTINSFFSYLWLQRCCSFRVSCNVFSQQLPPVTERSQVACRLYKI